MFRKVLVITIAAISLGACATPGGAPSSGSGGTPIISTGNPDVDAIVVKAQDIAVKACGFLPTVSTVSGILSTFIPGAAPINSLATQIAEGICGAVAKKGFRRGGPAPKYRGVAIHGERVR